MSIWRKIRALFGPRDRHSLARYREEMYKQAKREHYAKLEKEKGQA